MVVLSLPQLTRTRRDCVGMILGLVAVAPHAVHVVLVQTLWRLAAVVTAVVVATLLVANLLVANMLLAKVTSADKQIPKSSSQLRNSFYQSKASLKRPGDTAGTL